MVDDNSILESVTNANQTCVSFVKVQAHLAVQ